MTDEQRQDGAAEAAVVSDGEVYAPGNSAVEIAARRGFGPLLAKASEQWHGDSRPCVSCGQLVRRDADACVACGEDLSDDMLRKMRQAAGPWYVLEHVRPFPGVTLDRLVRQVRRGVLTRTTIVRGPTTFHQWRYAGETPGLSKFLGVCWNCQTPVGEADAACLGCGVSLDAGVPGEVAATETASPSSDSSMARVSGVLVDGAGRQSTAVVGVTQGDGVVGSGSSYGAGAAAGLRDDLDELRAAVSSVGQRRRGEAVDVDQRVGGVPVSWIIVAIMVSVVGLLFAIVSMRGGG